MTEKSFLNGILLIKKALDEVKNTNKRIKVIFVSTMQACIALLIEIHLLCSILIIREIEKLMVTFLSFYFIYIIDELFIHTIKNDNFV